MDKKNIKKIAVLSILGLMASGCMNSGNKTSSSEANSSKPTPVVSSSSEKTSSTITENSSSSTSTVVTVTEIEVTGSYKTQYLIGESLDLTGVQLLVTYSDNSTNVVAVTENMVTPVDMSTEGMKTVNISYEGLTTSFYIFVSEPEGEKVDPEVSISIENGDTLVIGKDAAPTVTVPEGLNYTTYYEQDEVFVSNELPTTPGTYSFIVEVEGNNQYNSVRVWRWFRLVEDKKTPEVEFSIESGAELVLGVDAEPTVTVTPGLDYTVRYDKDEAFYSNDFPTEEGTYAMVVNVEGNAEYNDRTAWVVFKLVAPSTTQKVDPEVSISIENGDTLVIGKDAAPTVTVPEGLNYVTYYEQNEVKVSDTLPTTAGTYSFIVEVEGNDQYNSVRVWRWFRLVEDKKTPEVEFSIESGEELVLGVDAAPTVSVSAGLNYTVHYEKNEAFYSNSFPTELGTYAMVVNVEGNDQYNSRTAWVVFKLVAPSTTQKVDPEVSISIENGDTLVIGKDAAPTVTVPEGLNYVTYYEQNEVKVSDTLPTTPGTYSFIVEVEGNDQYNSLRVWRWFRLEAPSTKAEAEITFNYEAGTEYMIGSSDRPTVTVSEGADYVITYESESGYNSTEFPTEPGAYSLVVTVNENEVYKASKQWLWFRLVENGEVTA